jgi:hypothetical protein
MWRMRSPLDYRVVWSPRHNDVTAPPQEDRIGTRLAAVLLLSVTAALAALATWFRFSRHRYEQQAARASALSSQRAPRQATAHDPTAMEVAARQQGNAELQRVIDSVLRSHGGQPARRVVPALRAALHANGLSADPESWLRAVATELANNHVYLVSPSAAETYETDSHAH